MRRARAFGFAALAGGFFFLYAPIVSMMAFSFNASRLVTVWDAANSPTLRWYAALLDDRQLLGAAWLSVQIAVATASIAVVLGTLAGVALARFGPFRGRSILSGLVAAPLVMPEVITGLSLLLLFVAMEQVLGWPGGRGALTIIIAHVTFTMAFVTIIVQSRLAGFDDSLEEAAMDLGARPLVVFLRITLPLITPAIASGWLLAFTLSWDDVVISQFVAGPGASTLPMVIFSKARLGVSPEINALATVLVLVVVSVVVTGVLVARRRERRAMATGGDHGAGF